MADNAFDAVIRNPDHASEMMVETRVPRRPSKIHAQIRLPPTMRGAIPQRVTITDPHSQDSITFSIDVNSAGLHPDGMTRLTFDADVPVDRLGNETVNRDAAMRALHENVAMVCAAIDQSGPRRLTSLPHIRVDAEVGEATMTMRAIDATLAEARFLGVRDDAVSLARQRIVRELSRPDYQPIGTPDAEFRQTYEQTPPVRFFVDPDAAGEDASSVRLAELERVMEGFLNEQRRCARAFRNLGRSLAGLDVLHGPQVERIGRGIDWGSEPPLFDWEPRFRHGADERAEELLLRHLSPAQREDYRQRQSFEVVGGRTGRRYRIHRKRQINVTDQDRRRLCLVMPSVPLGDQLLGQKLLLESDEDAFHQTAIDWGRR